eukprot:290800-Pyramimonas_sp.AAC.1
MPLGPFWGSLGPSRSPLGRYWAPLGPSWGGRGGVWDRLGAWEARKRENAKNIEKTHNENR